jgi:hypothetical protein
MRLSILINFQSDRNLFTNGLAGYILKNRAMGISGMGHLVWELLKYNFIRVGISDRLCRCNISSVDKQKDRRFDRRSFCMRHLYLSPLQLRTFNHLIL